MKVNLRKPFSQLLTFSVSPLILGASLLIVPQLISCSGGSTSIISNNTTPLDDSSGALVPENCLVRYEQQDVEREHQLSTLTQASDSIGIYWTGESMEVCAFSVFLNKPSNNSTQYEVAVWEVDPRDDLRLGDTPIKTLSFSGEDIVDGWNTLPFSEAFQLVSGKAVITLKTTGNKNIDDLMVSVDSNSDRYDHSQWLCSYDSEGERLVAQDLSKTPPLKSRLKIRLLSVDGLSTSASESIPTIVDPVTIELVSNASARISWQDLGNSNENIASYKVYRRSETEEGFSFLANTSDLSYLDVDLPEAERIYYLVSALNSSGQESYLSRELQVSVSLNSDGPDEESSETGQDTDSDSEANTETGIGAEQDVGLQWSFWGDSQTDGRAEEASVKSQAIAFRTIWETTFAETVDMDASGVSGGSLYQSNERYSDSRNKDLLTWVHFQESGNQNRDFQRTPAEFANTFTNFVREIRASSPNAVISTETAYSFQREARRYRDWTAHNAALINAINNLKSEGIEVVLADTDTLIQALVQQTSFQQVMTDDGGHYRGIGNLMIALGMYSALGYDVNALDLSGITEISDSLKQQIVDIASQ